MHFDNKKYDASFTVNHTGKKFSSDANTIELDGITIARINGGRTIEIEEDKTLRLGFNVFNLFDSSGITEGNPRAGSGGQAAGAYFVGRPILPRRFFLTATFDF